MNITQQRNNLYSEIETEIIRLLLEKYKGITVACNPFEDYNNNIPYLTYSFLDSYGKVAITEKIAFIMLNDREVTVQLEDSHVLTSGEDITLDDLLLVYKYLNS